MLLRLHHAAIICSDYERSKRFYTEVLGLRMIAEHLRAERQSWKLDLALPDGSQIELFSFPACMVEGVGVEGLNFRLSATTDWRRLPPPRLPASIRN